MGTDNEVRKGTILINKTRKNIKLRVIHIHGSGRLYKVTRIDNDVIGSSNFNYDHIIRHYDIMPLLKDTLKKL